MKIILVCRHGEAFKNLKGVYGGQGSGLTEEGRRQITQLCKNIQNLTQPFPISIYRSCDRVHVSESAEIIRNLLGVEEVRKSDLFKPIRLGIFDGMDRQRQMQLYPKACEAHQKWEKGEIDITESECLVEGMQPALEYYEQTKRFLLSLPDDGFHILVGTRSDLSCVQNVINGQSPAIYKSYKCYRFPYAGVLLMMESDGVFKPLELDEGRNDLEIFK